MSDLDFIPSAPPTPPTYLVEGLNGFISYIDYVRDLPDGAFTSTLGTYAPPLSRVKERRVANAAQQQTAMTDFEVRIDLGSAQQIDLVALLGCSVADGPSIGYSHVRVSTTSAHDGDLYDEIQSHPYRNVMRLTGGVVGQFVSIVYGVNPVDALRLGRVWIGPIFRLKIDRGWSFDPQDGATIYRSEGNQVYARQRPVHRTLEFTSLFQREVAFGTEPYDPPTVLDMRVRAGTGRELIVCPVARNQHMANTTAIYGLLSGTAINHRSGLWHTFSGRVEESL